MTPSNPSPDTGAGTPLTEMAARHLDRRYPPPADPMYREPDLSADEWREAYFALADVAQRQLDAARSRPATDPAGLDGETMARAFYEVSRRRPALTALLPEWDALPESLRAGSIKDGAEVAAEYARLSVADGPGPEDEWFGQSLGVPDPRLERRSR